MHISKVIALLGGVSLVSCARPPPPHPIAEFGYSGNVWGQRCIPMSVVLSSDGSSQRTVGAGPPRQGRTLSAEDVAFVLTKLLEIDSKHFALRGKRCVSHKCTQTLTLHGGDGGEPRTYHLECIKGLGRLPSLATDLLGPPDMDPNYKE